MPEQMRAYQLLKLGVGLAEQDEAPAVLLDWLLAIEGAVREVEADQAERAERGSP